MREGSLLIERGAPAVTPVVTLPIKVATLPFRRSPLGQAEGRLSGQLVLLAPALLLGQTFRGFGIKLLRHRGGAALLADAQHHQLSRRARLAQADAISGLHLARGFGHLIIDPYPIALNLFSGQRSGLEKPCGPQPLVNAKFVHKKCVGQC